MNRRIAQEAGRSGPLASSLLAHLTALALAATLSLPGSQPPEIIELNLSLVELTAEGGGGGSGTPKAGGPARHQRPQPAASSPAGKLFQTPQRKPPPEPRPVTPETATSPSRPETPHRKLQPEPKSVAPETATSPSRAETPSRLASDQHAGEAPVGVATNARSGTGSGGSGGTGGLGAGGWGSGLGPGVGDGLSGVPAEYLLALHSEIERHQTYPPRARRNGWEGEVRVRFIVERDGKVSRVEVVSSSGCSVLDEAAAATLERIERLPPPPASLKLSRLRLELPVVYRLTR